MSDKQIVLIDTGSIFHPLFHVTGSDPNPDALSIAIIDKIRALASGHKHVALCVDSKKSFRKDLDSSYKAARESKPAFFYHQIRLALEVLAKDGFPIWEADGYEADDLLAAGVEQAKVGHWPVLLISADKDALQLVDDRVSVKSPITGNVMTEEAVCEKFGVNPNQIMDYLAIVGDASDGVVGVKGIGAKGASAILKIFGNLDDLYAAIDKGAEEGIKPAQSASLLAFRERLPIVRQLLALRTDAPIDFAQVLKERTPDDVATFSGEDDIMSDINEAMPTLKDEMERVGAVIEKNMQRELTGAQASDALGSFVAHAAKHMEAPPKDMGTFAADVARRVAPKPHETRSPDGDGQQATGPAVGEGAAILPPAQPSSRTIGSEPIVSHSLVPVVVDYERQLEPRSLPEAKQLAQWAFESRLFSAFGSPQAVMTTILAGREIGLSAMASLRGFMVVDGKPSMSADLIRALVQRSSQCEYFRCIERTAEQSTWATKRRGEPDEQRLTFTLAEGRAAWQKDQRAWDQSNWGKRPANMVAKTASSMLARLVYADVVMNLYCAEEMDV